MLTADTAHDFRELYYRWEREQWSAGDIDLDIDVDQWGGMPEDARRVVILGLNYGLVSSEQLMKTLVPLVDAAPTEEQQVFLATQLVDIARHAVFYDMYFEQVVMRSGSGMDARLTGQRDRLHGASRSLLFETLPHIVGGVKAAPDDRGAFAAAVVLHHVLLEGTIARTGTHVISALARARGVLPGLSRGLDVISTDLERHVEFGTRFLRGFVSDVSTGAQTIRDRLENLVPQALAALDPYEMEDAGAFARDSLVGQLAAIGIKD